MLVSSFGRTTCSLQVGGLFLLGAVLSVGLGLGGFPELSALGVIPGAFGLFLLSSDRVAS